MKRHQLSMTPIRRCRRRTLCNMQSTTTTTTNVSLLSFFIICSIIIIVITTSTTIYSFTVQFPPSSSLMVLLNRRRGSKEITRRVIDIKYNLYDWVNSKQQSLKSEVSIDWDTIPTDNNFDFNNDTQLLNLLSLEQLQELCDQCNHNSDNNNNNNNNETAVSSRIEYDVINDTKMDLLYKLRKFANDQAEIEQQRLVSKRITKVENGYNDIEDDNSNSKERYEIIGNNDISYYTKDNDNDNDNDDTNINDQGYFYFELPKITTELKQAQERSHQNVTETTSAATTTTTKTSIRTGDQVTAPPPPAIPNSNGERVVKTYSTKDMNDLTGIAAAQPGYSSFDAVLSNVGGNKDQQQQQPWDTERQMTVATTSNQQMEAMKEQLMELVSTLLAMSGAPAFVTASLQDDDDDDDDNDDILIDYTLSNNNNIMRKNKRISTTSRSSRTEFVGFNPTKVPVEILTTSSKAIRAGRGTLLDEVLQQYEMQAIGYDGMAGDNIERGGGHYREVQKVRAFLNGYRRAEVRRMARETITVLLEKIMVEGIDSLDTTFQMMVRSDDDISSTTAYGDDNGGTTLNDSLIDYLNDMIRQKEKEVDGKFGKERQQLEAKWTDHLLQQHDDDISNTYNKLDQYWNVTEVDGQRIETFDPSNEHVKQIIQMELDQPSSMNNNFLESSAMSPSLLPQTAPEQVLLLLKLLRDRIKAEAIYSFDEKGRNLRLLAYCLRILSPIEREQLILKQLGNSIDRLDSFIELVRSSIEYAESASYELRPSTSKQQQSLNVNELRQILQISIDLRQSQSMKASGLRP